jgi:hypothetical protein
MTKKVLLLGVLFSTLFLSRTSFAQANVNENLESAFLWVDTNVGSDTNPGTQSQPMKTISAAVSVAMANNQHSIGTQININPGTYRESVTLSASSKTTSYPITIQAVTAGSVTVSGGVVYMGWAPYSANSSIYTVPWTANWGLCAQLTSCAYQPPIMMRQEMFFVNGTPLTQVLSQSLMQPGTFYVDTVGDVAYIWPDPSVNMSTATVEAATLSNLLTLSGMSDVVIRGIVFQYANTCHAAGAVEINGSTNVLIDSDIFQWNNAQGLSLQNPTANFTVQNSLSLHNGDSGFHEGQTNYGLWQNDVASYNNWRGAQAGYYACNTSGLHAYLAHHDTINNLTTSFNQTYGIHWDTDAYNISNNGGMAVSNLLSGLFVEKVEGPISFNNSYVCNQTSNVALGGMQLRNSENVTLNGDVLSNNSGGQVYMTGQPGGLTVTNWETGQQYNLVTSYLTMTGNTFIGNSSNQLAFYDGYLGGTDWSTFQTTLNSGSNDWWNSATTAAFTVPTPVSGTQDTLAAWQAVTGQDFSSTFSAPAGNPAGACSLTPTSTSYADYWFTVDNGTLTTDPSGHATFNLTMTPLNFTNSATLMLDGISEVPGLSATLTPMTLAPSSNAVLSVTAATTTAPGTYPLTVLATSGSITHSVGMLLTIPGTSIYLSTINLPFSATQINTTGQSQSFTITNIGSSYVGISSIVSSSNSFLQSNNCAAGLNAGKTCTVTVTFTPLGTGSLTGTITVTDNDVTSPQTVNVSGTGLAAPSVSFSPSPLAFGNVEVSYPSAPMTVTITNTASSTAAPLTFTSILTTGAKASDYVINSNTCPMSPVPLAAGANCTVTLTFTPGAAGSRNANLTINDNTGGDNQDIESLTGTGIQPTASLTPATLTFAAQLVNSPSPTQTFTYTNTSASAVLTMGTVSIKGSNPGDWSQSNNCPASLAAGASCTFTVTFTPGGTGSRSGTVNINDNTGAGTEVENLSGTGAWPTDSFTPATLTYTSQLVGTTSPGQTTTFANTSAVPLTITNITIAGAYPGDFAQTNTCPATLAAGANCTITTTFTPSGTGSHSANVKVYSNTTTSPDLMTVTGTGALPAVSFAPTSLTFASQLVGTVSPSQSVSMTNISAVQQTITGVSFTGSNPGDFAQTNNCGAGLASGAACTITVTFAPGAVGNRTATVKVSDNSTGGSESFTLSGTGAYPTASFTPQSLTFSTQLVGTTSPSQSTTLTNTSAVPLTINSVTLTGAKPGDYAQSNTCPATVAAGATCTITVTFTPTGSGTRNATISVSDNSSSGTDSASLTGTGAYPTVSFTPTSLNFGSLLPGSPSSPQTVSVSNTSSVQWNISSVAVTGSNPGDYTQTNTCGSSVPAGGTCTVTVNFTPGAIGTRNANITFTDNSVSGTDQFTVTGVGANPTVTFSPTSLTYGNQLVGTTSPSQSVTMTNTSAVPLNISSIVTGGSKPGDYAPTNNCGSTVAAGASCTITVTFTPTAAGTRNANVTVNDNVSGGTSTFTLTGTGAQPTVTFTPTSLTFTSQLLGTTSPSQSVTLTNTGVVQLNISSITLSGAQPGDYAQTNTCGASIAAGGTCTVTVTFTPTATGTRNATLNVNDNSSSGDDTFTVTGTGSLPTVSFSPSSLTFANQLPGTPSLPQTVILTNTSSVLLSINSVTLTGANPGDYSQINTCGVTLAAGLTCTITVTFTPSTTGTRTATVTVSDTVSGGSSTFNLTGTGGYATVSFSPSPLQFNTVQVGVPSTMTETLTNSSTSVPLTINSFAFTGTNTTNYTQTNNCPVTLAANASCSISVTYTPTASGSQNSTLTVYDNVSGGTSTLTVKGTGAYPTASFSPSTVAFGNQEIGIKSSSMTTTLTNTGSYPLNINSVTMTGSKPGDYSQSNNCPSSLAAGASCTFTVWVTAGGSGSRNATLTVNDNASAGTTTASLTATGNYPTASLTPTTLAFGNQEVGYPSAPIVATLTNTSSWTLNITSVTLSGSKPGDYLAVSACPASLAPNASCTVSVTFTPTATGSRTATLNVNDNVSGGKTTTSLTGTGTKPTATLSPGSDNFGTVTVGHTSSSKTSTLTNTSTNGAILNVSSIAITGTNKSDYSQTNNCPATLAVNASCTITVTFTPTAAGTRTANVTVTDNESAGSRTITLTGTGQ